MLFHRLGCNSHTSSHCSLWASSRWNKIFFRIDRSCAYRPSRAQSAYRMRCMHGGRGILPLQQLPSWSSHVKSSDVCLLQHNLRFLQNEGYRNVWFRQYMNKEKLDVFGKKTNQQTKTRERKLERKRKSYNGAGKWQDTKTNPSGISVIMVTAFLWNRKLGRLQRTWSSFKGAKPCG